MENTINYERIEQAIHYLAADFQQQPDLDEIARQLYLSPFHFQRMFTDWVGISPKRFTQYLTADYLKTRLRQTKNLSEAAESAGLSTPSRVYDLFVQLEAVTPQEFKMQGAGLTMQYGFHPTPFGECLIGVTARGVSWLSFTAPEQKAAAFAEMQNVWRNAQFEEQNSVTALYIDRIFSDRRADDPLKVAVRGTNFQIKVWEALLSIPAGELTSYQEIAEAIGNPKALQAVGSAVGANAIAYLIPCHRVIKKEGIIGGYRWGSEKKRAIVGWEMARYEAR